jgi:hypothetical protein
MLRPFNETLWIAEGPTADVAGFTYPTRTVIIRLSDGGLFVWSPTALTEPLTTALQALGEIRYIVAPNSLHHLFLAEWQSAYPEARVFVAPGLDKRRPDLRFDETLEDGVQYPWSKDIDHVLMRGSLITTEVVFFHHHSRTAIFTDLIQHFRPGWFSGWRAVIARLDLMTAPLPETPRKFRTSFVDRRSARAAIRQILAWPTENVLMAHADPITGQGQAFVVRTFRWLTG